VASSASVRKAPESHQLDAGHREGAFEARAAPGDRTCAGGERELLDWTAAGVDRAREGSLQAGQGGEQGRLAGAVVADHGDGGAGLEVEIEPPGQATTGPPDVEPAELEQRCAHASSRQRGRRRTTRASHGAPISAVTAPS